MFDLKKLVRLFMSVKVAAAASLGNVTHKDIFKKIPQKFHFPKGTKDKPEKPGPARGSAMVTTPSTNLRH